MTFHLTHLLALTDQSRRTAGCGCGPDCQCGPDCACCGRESRDCTCGR